MQNKIKPVERQIGIQKSAPSVPSAVNPVKFAESTKKGILHNQAKGTAANKVLYGGSVNKFKTEDTGIEGVNLARQSAGTVKSVKDTAFSVTAGAKDFVKDTAVTVNNVRVTALKIKKLRLGKKIVGEVNGRRIDRKNAASKSSRQKRIVLGKKDGAGKKYKITDKKILSKEINAKILKQAKKRGGKLSAEEIKARVKLSKVYGKLDKLSGREVKLSMPKKAMSSAFLAAGGAFTNLRADKNEISNTGIETVRFAGQATDYAKTAVSTAKDVAKTSKAVIVAPVKIAKTSVQVYGGIKKIPQKINNVRTTLTAAGKRAALIKKSLVKSAKVSYRAGQAAAKQAAKAAKKTAEATVRVIAQIIKNPTILAAVGGFAILIISISAVSSAAGGMVSVINSGIQSTIGWLLPQNGNNNNQKSDTERLREQYNAYIEETHTQWDSYVSDVLSPYYDDYEEVTSNDTFFDTVNLNEFFAVLFVNKLKTHPNLKVEEAAFTSNEIHDFLTKYITYEAITGGYDDGDDNYVTTADITFSLNPNVMNDLGFTDDERKRVDAIKETLREVIS